MNAKLLAVLLGYPGEGLVEGLPELRSAAAELPRAERRALEPVLDALAATPLSELRRAYVETFDFDRRCGLHVTYHTHGDRRQRGLELVRLKRRFAEAGLPFESSELPDYLPVLLEFVSLRPDEGRELLVSFRAPLELIRSGLHARESVYAGVLDALCLALPAPTARQLEEARRLAEEGPPAELVGLEPFGSPELAEVGP
ncbi:MAG TPA: nitrate reductase molybdenum cofactor assembly chaperone [Gaiella sp.]|nr:nitrate reductase molybdenum cofactor assembly chaperone [Gaiella sp.]